MKTLLPLILAIVFLSCANSPSDLKKDLTGTWQTTKMEAEIKNMIPQLVENARTLALATSYEFNNNDTYTMTISKNSLDNGRIHKGRMSLNTETKELTLTSDTVLVGKSNGEWKQIEKGIFSAPIFEPVIMTVEEINESEMILSEKETGGVIYYTLERVL